jgi:hypothetical protein
LPLPGKANFDAAGIAPRLIERNFAEICSRPSVARRVRGTRGLGRPLLRVIAQRWTVALRTIRAALLAAGIAACVCACAPSDPAPIAASHPAPVATAALTEPVEAPRYYGSSTEPRARHHTAARHAHHHHEAEQAQADTVNPPFGAGE